MDKNIHVLCVSKIITTKLNYKLEIKIIEFIFGVPQMSVFREYS